MLWPVSDFPKFKKEYYLEYLTTRAICIACELTQSAMIGRIFGFAVYTAFVPKGANMRQRGKKSVAALAIESAEPKPILEPPSYMAARERAEWRAIVAKFGSEAFPPETRTLLAALCGMQVALASVSAELSKLGPGIPSDRSGWCKFRDLIALRGQLASQVASVGTKLRVLPQSRDVRRLKTADYERRLAEDDIKPWTDNVN